MQEIETEVLVVGAGPTGMTAAILLARQGIDCVVVDRRDGPRREPAAHCVNARSFEIWRQAGVDMDAVLALASDPREAGAVHWVTRLGGEVLGSLPYENQGDEVLAVTPTPLRNLAQHRLEPVLAAEVERLAGRAPLWSHAWESSEQSGDEVVSRVRSLAGSSGDSSTNLRSRDGGASCAQEASSGATASQAGPPTAADELVVRSRYVIAADGAGSPVRKSLGIDVVGPDRIQAFLMIHFEADLRSLVGEDRGVLYWVSDPACSGVFVAHDLGSEWVFMHSWDPEREPRDSFTPAHCEALLRRAMEDRAEGVPLTIRTVSPWIMTSQVAGRWSEGRIFLAGDATHRFPPTGGLGLNSGVQDAHNLAWKMAAVLRGRAGAGLLASYEAERKPVAQFNADQSLANAMKIVEVPIAMGTVAEPEEAARAFAAMLADDARRAEVAAAIAAQATHFDMLGLQLGYTYAGDAVIDDGSPPPQVADPVRDFAPSARPGSRLPHGWVWRAGACCSTLDLVAPDSFVLLVAPGSAWKEAGLATGLPVVEWGRDVDDRDGWWSGVAGVAEGGALLVRPDQHVAARFGHATGAGEAEAGLRRAMERMLPR